jgi:hypothetical protein
MGMSMHSLIESSNQIKSNIVVRLCLLHRGYCRVVEQIPYPGPIYFLGKFLRRFAIQVRISSGKEEKQTNPSVMYPWSTLRPKRLDSEYEMWFRARNVDSEHRRQRARIGSSDMALKSATFDSLVRPPHPAFVQWHPLSMRRLYSRRRTLPFQ